MRKTMVFGSMVLSLLMLAPYALADQGGKHGPGGTHGKETHMKVSGVVSKVESKYITVKTTWGSLVITSDTSSKNLEVGEEVEMTVNENNTVIDVHRKGDPAHAHRFVTGKLVYVGKRRRRSSSGHRKVKKFSRSTGSRLKLVELRKARWSRWN